MIIPNYPNNKTHAETAQKFYVCKYLALIYNSGVTFLRHHWPMVTHWLGEADQDGELLRLVHTEVDKLAMDALQKYAEGTVLAQPASKSRGVC